jgi:uncharacterized protein (TIGR02001 family)
MLQKEDCALNLSIIAVALMMVSAPGGRVMADGMTIEKPAAPEPSKRSFDLGYGSKLGSDYQFRGMTQTDGDPTVQAYVEGRFHDWFYAGINMSNVAFPAYPWQLSDPVAEIDFYGGMRHTWDKLTLDLGAVYYYYPGEIPLGGLGNGAPVAEWDMWEIYARPTLVVTDKLTLGVNVFYSDNYAGTGAWETYAAGTARLNLPNHTSDKDFSWFTSGEIGYQSFGFTDFELPSTANYQMPEFTYWNAGLAFVYKVMTLDLRYHQNTLTSGMTGTCILVSGLADACGDRYIATLSFDNSLFAK